jgi:hypothetical protein
LILATKCIPFLNTTYFLTKFWMASKWITPLWAAGVRVFLEVVVVILVGVANALTHFGHQIIGNYMLCGMRLTFTAFEVASVFSHCAYFAPVSASASGPGV